MSWGRIRKLKAGREEGEEETLREGRGGNAKRGERREGGQGEVSGDETWGEGREAARGEGGARREGEEGRR